MEWVAKHSVLMLPAVAAAPADVLWQMVREGLAMIDDGDPRGQRLYWVPCTGIEAAIDVYGRQAKLPYLP